MQKNSEDTLTNDEKFFLKNQHKKKSKTLNIRFTESEYQSTVDKCEQFVYRKKSEYVRDCVRTRISLETQQSAVQSDISFYVNGKPPEIIDLLDKFNALKSKYNTFVAEHETFVVKRDTARNFMRKYSQTNKKATQSRASLKS